MARKARVEYGGAVYQTPSLPDASPRSDRFRRSGRESKFLADRRGK